MQLCPGRMYATHVIPGTNYFSVKISNYKEIKKLNITLTALTGNAYMNIYDDFNLEKKQLIIFIINYSEKKYLNLILL